MTTPESSENDEFLSGENLSLAFDERHNRLALDRYIEKRHKPMSHLSDIEVERFILSLAVRAAIEENRRLDWSSGVGFWDRFKIKKRNAFLLGKIEESKSEYSSLTDALYGLVLKHGRLDEPRFMSRFGAGLMFFPEDSLQFKEGYSILMSLKLSHPDWAHNIEQFVSLHKFDRASLDFLLTEENKYASQARTISSDTFGKIRSNDPIQEAYQIYVSRPISVARDYLTEALDENGVEYLDDLIAKFEQESKFDEVYRIGLMSAMIARKGLKSAKNVRPAAKRDALYKEVSPFYQSAVKALTISMRYSFFGAKRGDPSELRRYKFAAAACIDTLVLSPEQEDRDAGATLYAYIISRYREVRSLMLSEDEAKSATKRMYPVGIPPNEQTVIFDAEFLRVASKQKVERSGCSVAGIAGALALGTVGAVYYDKVAEFVSNLFK